jgi:hypothetical protein
MSDVASNQDELPGFAEFVGKVVDDRGGAVDLTDEKKYTAEVVLRDYPGTYKSVVRALFYYRLPTRTVRDLFRMSGATVAAIRNQVLAAGSNGGAASFFTKARAQSQRDIVLCQLLDVIEERLHDPAKLASLSITELAELLSRLERAKPASNGTENKNEKDITIVEADQFDAVLDGLEDEKKFARQIGGDSVGLDGGSSGENGGSGGAESAADCSTRSGNDGVCSV